MALLPLQLLGAPVLREKAVEVAQVDDALRQFIADMFETMDVAHGVGLAANQVGVARRVAVIDAEGERFAMVNPRIVEASGRATAEEGCLSIPDVYGDVTRPERVVLEALDEHGTPYRKECGGLVARAIQHEIDHLDGIVFLDHLSALKRSMLVKKYQKEHKGEGTVKVLQPESAGRE